MLKRFCICVVLAASGVPTFAHADPMVPRIHRLCAEIGLTPGAYDFFYCVQTLAAFVGVPPAVAAARDPGDANLHVYGDFRHADRNLLEQRACAGLGLDVGSQPFSECVVNLDNALGGF